MHGNRRSLLSDNNKVTGYLETTSVAINTQSTSGASNNDNNATDEQLGYNASQNTDSYRTQRLTEGNNLNLATLILPLLSTVHQLQTAVRLNPILKHCTLNIQRFNKSLHPFVSCATLTHQSRLILFISVSTSCSVINPRPTAGRRHLLPIAIYCLL